MTQSFSGEGLLKIVFLGAGGHASDLLGVFEASGRADEVIGLCDDGDANEARFRGKPILGTTDSQTEATHFMAAVGWPAGRRAIAAKTDLLPVTIVHPQAEVPDTVKVGEGSAIFANTSISPNARIGRHVYVAQGSSVGHDTVLGDYTSLMPCAVVSGDCMIGEGVTIGTNATVIEGLSVGDGATIGAGAVVVKDVAAGETVIGNPAKPLHKKS